jgi:epoxyqueuosine reductase
MNSEKNVLTQELQEFSRQGGADLFGVADLTPARDFLVSRDPSMAEQYPRAVSIGLQLCDAIVDGHNPEEAPRESLYWHHVYDVVTPALNFLSYKVARWLTDRNFHAFPIPASSPYGLKTLEGIFSHKLAAHLAGLGWIGKSCLLLTERFGPRARFVSVLTDAPLETGAPYEKPCGKCHACVDACPVKAFTGVEFHSADPREIRFDVHQCGEYRLNHACGRCVSSCPVGKRQFRKRNRTGE